MHFPDRMKRIHKESLARVYTSIKVHKYSGNFTEKKKNVIIYCRLDSKRQPSNQEADIPPH